MKNKRRLKQIFAIAIVYIMALTLCAGALAANPADFTDLPDRTHYSYSGVIAAIQNGIMYGDGNGHFMPEKTMKRVEAATYLVRVMNAKAKADVSGVTDYAYGSWYDTEGSLAIAINMGLVDVVNGRVNPDDEITREEAFEMMARAINATGGSDEDLAKFPDAKDVSAKHKDSLASLVKGGYVHGSQLGSTVVMNPKVTISRAEFATLFGCVFEQYITQAGVYTSVHDGNVVINGSGITLKDAIVTGDLIIGDGAGDITLDNTIVDGRVIVRGGSVHLGGSLEHVAVVNRNAKVTLAADAEINMLLIDGDYITVNTSLGSLVNTLVIEGKSAKVAGYVIINNAYINTSGAVIESSPAETIIAKNISANVGGNNVNGTFTSAVNAPTVTLRLGSGAHKNLDAIYSAAKTQAQRNRIVIEIATTLDDILVIDSDNFPGNNNVTVKYDSGYSASLGYGVAIDRSNVTLDGLTFNISDLSKTVRGDSAYHVVSVDGCRKSADGKNILIKNTTLKNCNINFYNEFSGFNVTAAYFDSTTTSNNTVTGGNIDVSGQMLPFETVGVHAGSVTLNDVSIKSNDRALVVDVDDLFADIAITGNTVFYTMSGVAVELRMDKSELANMENAFGTVFGGYSNLKYGAVRNFIDRILHSAVKEDTESGYISGGVKLRDYNSSLAEVYYKDEGGYIWSRCLIANTWVYCNTPVVGSFVAGRMYMLTDANSLSLTTGDTRYVMANGMLSNDYSDMATLTTSTATIANHPFLNNSIRYKVVSMLPHTGEINGLVASLTSIPYAVDTHFAANGTELGTDDPLRAGNLNSGRTGRMNLTVSGTPDTAILLYFNLNAATLGVKGDSGISAWHFVDGVENSVDSIFSVYDNPENPLAVNSQEIAIDAVSGVNTFIIKGDDGSYIYIVVTVTVN